MNPDSSIVPMLADFDHKRFNSLWSIKNVMTLKRATIFVSGDVQMAGFRTFVKNLADSLAVKGYAENLPDGRVRIVCEGEEKSIAELATSIKTKAPALSEVEDLKINYGKYIGEFVDFERKGEDVPRKATLDDLLNVMISFDNKAEKMVGILGDIKSDTSQIKQDTTQIRQDTSQIKQDTAHIPNIVENTSMIPAMKEDTSEIKTSTGEIADKLQNKYEEMSREIAQMKITLARIETKVFS